jgi:hypothetical protein
MGRVEHVDYRHLKIGVKVYAKLYEMKGFLEGRDKTRWTWDDLLSALVSIHHMPIPVSELRKVRELLGAEK